MVVGEKEGVAAQGALMLFMLASCQSRALTGAEPALDSNNKCFHASSGPEPVNGLHRLPRFFRTDSGSGADHSAPRQPCANAKGN